VEALQCYQSDPVGFCREVLGSTPWSKQIEILEALRDHPRVTVRAGHGVGKTHVAASAVLWRLHCFSPSVVLTTAPTHRQVKEILWREIRRQQGRARLPLEGEVRETTIKLRDDTFALGLSTDEPDRFQGFHSPNILVVVDEASGVPEPIYEAIDGALTTAGARLLLIGNPTRPTGRFADSHRLPGWHKVHISTFDTPNLQAGDLVRPELVAPGWVAEKREEWGEESPIYQVRVLGQFPDSADDTLFPLSWIEAATARAKALQRHLGFAHHGGTEHTEKSTRRKARRDRDRQPLPCSVLPPCTSPCPPCLRGESALPQPQHPTTSGEPVEIGVDVARYGSCETVAVVRRGPLVIRLEAWQGQDLMVTTGRVVALVRQYAPVRAVTVDVIGLGAGVVDRLREQGFRQVAGLNVAERALQPERYASRRDEIYFGLRDRFRDGEIAVQDEKLAAQLAAMRYAYTSRGQLKVESKEEMRDRGLKSPDRADALALAFAPTHVRPLPYTAAGLGRPGVPRLG
jgi:phage terminase large subunit